MTAMNKHNQAAHQGAMNAHKASQHRHQAGVNAHAAHVRNAHQATHKSAVNHHARAMKSHQETMERSRRQQSRRPGAGVSPRRSRTIDRALVPHDVGSFNSPHTFQGGLNETRYHGSSGLMVVRRAILWAVFLVMAVIVGAIVYATVWAPSSNKPEWLCSGAAAVGVEISRC
ncbi:hypothetical protein ACQPXH_15820 [Nocardia sp. CA-135953]|uniref:hypothetical protein n=1 Tax=Nocardia sp. CA-135953 TaxID=3239978 RepID=UPI003D957BCB